MTTPNTEPQYKRHIIVTGLFILITVGLLALLIKGLSLNPSAVSSTLIGKPAADFSVSLLQGEQWVKSSDAIKLSEHKGKPVVLNFWASWCVSCREEAKYFEAFWQRHKQTDVMVIGIAIQDTRDAAIQFAKAFGKTYPLGLDESGKATLDYGVYGVPETFFIDRSGTIRHKETGPMSLELLENKLALIQ